MGGTSCVCGAKTGETSMRGCVTTRKHQAIVTREWVTCSGSPVCSCARVCVCVSYCGILNGCMRMHACVCVCVRWSVPAAGVGLQHWGLVSPGAKNYGQWDPASELSCWRDPPCRYVEIYILISGPPSWLAREVSTMRPLVLFVLVWAWSVSVCVDLRGWQHVCMCCYACTWEYRLSLTTGWTWGMKLCSLTSPRLLDPGLLTQSSQ